MRLGDNRVVCCVVMEQFGVIGITSCSCWDKTRIGTTEDVFLNSI